MVKKSFIGGMLYIFSMHAMNPAAVQEIQESMKLIKSQEDVKPFIGKIVACKAEGFYSHFVPIFFSTLNDSNPPFIHYGYVNPSEKNYLHLYLKYNQSCRPEALEDSKLSENRLYMRLATKEEVIMLKEMYKNDQIYLVPLPKIP